MQKVQKGGNVCVGYYQKEIKIRRKASVCLSVIRYPVLQLPRDSMGDMLTELANVSPQVVIVLFLTVILYHIFEGHITWLIVHKTHRNIPA